MQSSEILQQIENRWHNAYWFSRMLINKDKYVALGKENKLLSTIASSLRIIAKTNRNSSDTIILQKQTLRNSIEDRYKKTLSTKIRVETLLRELDEMILR